MEPILTLEEAIEKNSFFEYGRKIEKGCVEEVFLKNEKKGNVLTGRIKEGGQEHFYLEPHVVLSIPSDNNEITVFSTTQCVTKTQRVVASKKTFFFNVIDFFYNLENSVFGFDKKQNFWFFFSLFLK